MEDWSTNQMPYSIGSVDEKILTAYQPNVDDLDIVDEYQTQILLLLFLEGMTKCSPPSLSFQGIKRKLDLHQQILTNALNRLLDKEFIQKSPDNHYILTKKGFQLIQTFSPNVSNSDLDTPTIENIYKTDISAESFLKSLKGKWFGDFRWIGWFQDSDSTKLEWISTDNSIEAVAWHKNSKINSYPYLIKTIIFQKSPIITPEEMKQKANWFKYHLNKKLAKKGALIEEYIPEDSVLQINSSKNDDWFYQNCVN
jgi:DNA-binding MarR family transcriptional regulator